MNGVSKEQIARAREVDLLGYLRTHAPDELVKVGAHEYATKTHDSLRISENGKWNWCSRGFGGVNALNYLVRVEGIDFVSAVKRLCAWEPAPLPREGAEICSNFSGQRAVSNKTFCAPAPDQNNDAVLTYLRKRGIKETVLQACVEMGLLYQTDRKGYKNCVFIGKNENGNPQYACVRGCGGNFRGDVAGSRKAYGFSIPARYQETETVEVYEAPIDALSGASLRVLAGREWRTVYYLALGGLSCQALDHFLAGHPQVKKLQLCLDNDGPGRAFAAKMIENYGSRGYRILDLPPPGGKDYNAYLQLRIRALSERSAER